jgi:hypothetical protein
MKATMMLANYRHRTRCDTDSACAFFVESAGAFDMFVVDDAPTED